jgi:hypothetical protein
MVAMKVHLRGSYCTCSRTARTTSNGMLNCLLRMSRSTFDSSIAHALKGSGGAFDRIAGSTER